MGIYSFIIFLHIIGTILGTGGATIAEAQINQALKDKQITADEKGLLHSNYFLIRVGMGFILISLIGMVIYHITNNSVEILLSNKVLFKEFLFVIIFANAIAISRKWVPLWLGASVSFTSWWGATFLGVADYLPYSFAIFLFNYLAIIIIVAGILHLIRENVMSKNK